MAYKPYVTRVCYATAAQLLRNFAKKTAQQMTQFLGAFVAQIIDKTNERLK